MKNLEASHAWLSLFILFHRSFHLILMRILSAQWVLLLLLLLLFRTTQLQFKIHNCSCATVASALCIIYFIYFFLQRTENAITHTHFLFEQTEEEKLWKKREKLMVYLFEHDAATWKLWAIRFDKPIFFYWYNKFSFIMYVFTQNWSTHTHISCT